MRYFAEFVFFVVQAFRAYVFLSPNLRARAPSLTVSLAVLSMAIGVFIVGDWLTLSAVRRQFDYRELSSVALVLMPLVVLAWLATRRLQNLVPDSFGQVLLLLLMMFAVYRVAMYFATSWFDASTLGIPALVAQFARKALLLNTVLMLWFAIAGAVLLFRLSEKADWVARGPRFQLLNLTFPLLLAFSAWIAQPTFSSGFWYSADQRPSARSIADETVINEQASLINAKVSSLLPQVAGQVDAYFIGFAPDATEEVFRLELETIHPLMDNRFKTEGRSLRLLNHSTTLSTFPVATQTNLAYALNQIGQLIDNKEDFLILYLTSHGSREHDLVPNFPPMRMNALNPTALRKMLDRSGIQNRVIVVSACFSGGFVEPLRSPTTLIMTASAKDKTSFGCGNDSDFTYFGKAVFDEALRKTLSFEQAFQSALPVIKEREAKITSVFSEPQIAVGDSIRPLLSAWEKRLGSK